MKIEINKLGRIDHCEIELNDLTILVGDNNSGKTYVTYSIYGLLKNWSDFVNYDNFKTIENKLRNAGQVTLNKEEIINVVQDSFLNESKSFQRRIKDLFNDKEKIFGEASVKIDFDKPTKFKDIAQKIKVGENITFEGKISDNKLTINYIKSADDDIDDGLFKRMVGDMFSSLVFDEVFPEPTIITAERLGISLFYKELDERRNSMIEDIQKLDQNDAKHPIDLIMNRSAYYSTPIRDHIAFTRNLDNIRKNSSKLNIDYPLGIIKEILGAEFKKEDKQDIRFYTKNKKNNRFDIPLYLASSSARCIVDIFFYLKHISKAGDILIIDEPESHLTLKNQRLMAKLLASIVNVGIKVFITTHSDFLVKELNNLILLSNQFKGKEHWLIKNKNSYSEKDAINQEKISVYQAVDGSLEKMKVTNKGIQVPFFDEEVNKLFAISSDLEYLID